ncbi:glycine--tRNA ligase [Candidatus Pacearchaeota archaeon]|nr:glycine--tRNA ligase [Candidatus Pacearchaeota archaeon]
MYIVKKKISGGEYYYVRKSIREGNKIKSKTISYAGKTLEEAQRKLEELKHEENKYEDKTISDKDAEKKEITIDELANFCKTKGFIFRSSDIYGGLAGFWDFGPLGVELFNNIKNDWWNFFVRQRDNMVGIEASIISHPQTWKASGHLTSFSDIAVVCKKCGKATKIDKSEVGKVKCECGGEYEVKGEFNLMFKTSIGALNPMDAYLRGETAQAMFMDFKLIQQNSRMQLPFGIAQIGRCFRNEIAPRDFLFRSREFNIGEFEFFIHPNDFKCGLLNEKHLNLKVKLLDSETQLEGKEELKIMSIGDMLKKGKLDEWHAYWLAEQVIWFNLLGFNKNEIKIREHTKNELSHYSSATFDIDYMYPFGSKEVAGIANRGQYDLTQHQKESKQDLDIFDEKTKSKVIPRVIEPTFGMERVFLAVLTKAYNYDKKRGYIVLKIPAKLAPIKAAVFPIIKKPEYEKISEDIVNDLKEEFNVIYDKSGSIGRRYARNDEIGTPMCITIDDKTPEDHTVTVRDRDTTKQVRVKINKLKEVVKSLINGGNILKLGKEVETRVKEN